MPSNDEELDLNGSVPKPSKPVDADGSAQEGDKPDVNVIKESVPNLRDLASPGQSATDFITNLLNTPEDKLIPWEECVLPSMGRYYGWPDGMVMVRAMGQTADKILGTARLAQSGQSIDYLLRECVRFPAGFDPLELLLGDRIFLLYYIRGITHGNMYEFAVNCPNQNCGAVSTHQYDLNELAKTIVWAKPHLGSEPFKVNLPWMSKVTGRDVWVGVRFLRASDANEILAKRKARKKLLAQPGNSVKTRQPQSMSQLKGGSQRQVQELDETINQNMEKMIVNVMGVEDQYVIRSMIAKLHAQDTATIREWLREHTPGVDNTVTVACPDCNHEFTMELPFSDSFFRPAKS